ncbi:MAG TPA: RDD family protein [Candidatus Acidoferrales bacterium]|nr:RDD family protein [Candidatus Acidoferrales bacterium]
MSAFTEAGVHQLFSGPNSLRDPSERFAFWATAVCALPAALLIGYVLHESIGASQVALFIAIAMVYVTLARGRLLGSSIRIHETQYPRLFRIVKDACAALEIPMPLVFVREEGSNVPVAALGFGEPYALVISSHFIESYEDDELAFAIGCELGHIAAGHTRFLSLLSVNGNENPLISLIFGAWLRRCTTSCDKIGLLCCGSLDAAIRAMSVSTFLEFGRKVDLEAFAEQQADIQADTISRWGQWLGADPYATARIASLRHFITSPQYVAAADWFRRERGQEPPALVAPGTTTVVDKDCAGWWRRFAAFMIDATVVAAIIGSFAPAHVTRADADTGTSVTIASPSPSAPKSAGKGSAAAAETVPKVTTSESGDKETVDVGPVTVVTDRRDELPSWLRQFDFNPTSRTGFTFWLTVYMALLVATAGQTFGMMIAGLRVVTVDFQPPGVARTIGRYIIVAVLMPLIIVLSLFWRRVLLHDRWTKTRLVKIERVVARATGTT